MVYAREEETMNPSTYWLNPNQRMCVLWFGEIDANLQKAFSSRNLQIKSIDCNKMQEVSAKSRAFVVPIYPDTDIDEDKVLVAVKVAMQNGLKVIALRMGGVTENNDRFLAIVMELQKLSSEIDYHHTEDQAITAILNHDPGMGYNPTPTIVGGISDEELEVLLRRSFNDLHGFELKQISGGKSGASVWLVEPSSEDKGYCDICFIAKFQKISRRTTEETGFQAVNMSFQNRYRAHLYAERSMTGFEYGLSVYQAVLRAQDFLSVLKKDPQKVIDSLFDSTFHDAWSRSVEHEGGLASILNSNLDVPGFRSNNQDRQATLMMSSVSARGQHNSLIDLKHLEGIFNNLPWLSYQQSTIHGDLHPGNIFVTDGNFECTLIDFGRSQRKAPTVVDPACLEVNLVFQANPEFDLKLLANPDWLKWIRDRYKYPLLNTSIVPLPNSLTWLDSAVTAIRGRVVRIESNNPYPYTIAVAAYLLRCASYSDYDIRLRALAYELACDLMVAVRDALT